MSGQKDFLKTCMESVNVDSTVDEFKQAFCSVCVNPECTRSQWSESKWLQRMIRQEQALQNPTIIDPNSDPRFSQHASQDFISVDDKQAQLYGGWVDVKEDGKIVHHAEPPTESKSSSKLDESVSSLSGKKKDDGGGGGGGEEGAAPLAAQSEPEPPKDGDGGQGQPEGFTPIQGHEEAEIEDTEDEPTEEPPPALQPQKQEPQKPKPRPKTKKPRKGSEKNTPKPDGGIMLEGGNESPQRNTAPKESKLLNKEDPWATPSEENDGSGGKLTVRISDGKVIKKE